MEARPDEMRGVRLELRRIPAAAPVFFGIPLRAWGFYSPDMDPRSLKVHRDLVAKDVPYVPTDDAVVAAMLRLAGVGSSDVIYDLGCGDGRILIHAAKHFGARGVGVDIDPFRITECREKARKARVEHLVRFECKSFFEVDLRDATLVTLYLLPSINVRLRPKLLTELRPGSRIVANYFGMGDWEPDVRAEAHHRILMEWIVPAWVAGRWRCVADCPGGRRKMLLELERKYQTVEGVARVGRRKVPVRNGRLFGEHLTFKLDDPEGECSARYSCLVHGTTMRGTCYPDAIECEGAPWGGVLHA